MSRIAGVLLALALLIALLAAVDPNARRKVEDALQNFAVALRQSDDKVVVNVPSVDVTPARGTATPVATATPFATTSDDDEDSSDEPIITINWDALGDSLRNFWESLKQVRIDINPRDNK